ncbi:hypothetical protein Aduo_012518 [Ancylostoma duodenale]
MASRPSLLAVCINKSEGKKKVLVFRIPDTNDSYVFCLARRNKSCDVYQCTGCKKMGAWKMVKVVGDNFMVDPCSIGHECTPVEFGRDKANRIAYSIVNDVRANPMAINSLKDMAVTLENIPEELSFLRDGTRFVQEQDPELHIYYSERTKNEKACTNGLFALVADGVHTSHLQAILDRYRPRPHQRLRVVLDFEKAAINAAKIVFTHSIVQGCAFHLSKAWNRRDSSGLRKSIQGPTKVETVEKWWDTIKGVTFLPTRLRSHVEALFHPPVPENHPAHRGSSSSATYTAPGSAAYSPTSGASGSLLSCAQLTWRRSITGKCSFIFFSIQLL